MAKVKIQGNASGTGILTVTAPNTSTDRTITLPDSTATIATTTDVAAKAPIASPEFTGNVGVQVTPENWNGARPSLQIGSTGSISGKNDVTDNHMNVTANAFLNRTSLSTGWDYMYTNKATNYYQQDGKHVFRTAPSGSADSAITWTTGFEVLNDGKARAKNGLLFGTDTAAANTLDDYEEGDWTPVGKFGGSAGPTGSFTGTYVKIGKQVTAAFNLPVSSLGSNTGAFTLTGLPFAPTHGNRHSTGWGYLHRIAGSTHEEMFCYLASGLIGFQEKGVNGNNSSGFTNSSFTASTHIAGSVTYETNS